MDEPKLPAPDYYSLWRTEKCPEFDRLMHTRRVMGALRYGAIDDENKPKYDRLASIEKRLAAFKEDRNAEHLVDIANLCLFEFLEGKHNGLRSIDDGIHTERE